MSFDALTLSAVRDELEPRLSGARAQKVVFVDELALAIEAFAPHVGRTLVLLSADLEHARIHQVDQLPTRGLARDTPFTLSVRKHLRNAHIHAVRQPRLERVFELDCEQRDASGRHYRLRLIVEAMGRRSNLVLVDADDNVIDAARRAPPSRNPRRPLLPHQPYVLPPPQARLFPEQISADALAADARPAVLLSKHLAERVAGLSPLAGRELAFRATGSTQATVADADWPRVAAAVRDLLALIDTHAWAPSLAFEGETPVDYAPYVLEHLAAAGARVERFGSIGAAIQTYFTRIAESGSTRRGDPLAAERRALVAPIDRALEANRRRLSALEHQLDQGQAQREPLRRAGELLLTHQAELAPGAAELLVNGERVELDPTLGGVENAQAYFARYRKAREAAERVPHLLEEARQRTAHLADLRALVEVADGMDSVRALRREVASATGGRAQPAKPAKPDKRGGGRRAAPPAGGPYRRVPLEAGWEALIGMSAAGNAAVTFDVAQAEDLWLHARNLPGAHVIVRGGGTAPDAVVERAAQLAAYHSAARAANAVEVDVAPRRYVKKIPGGPPGLVRYSNERTLRVTPRAADRVAS